MKKNAGFIIISVVILLILFNLNTPKQTLLELDKPDWLIEYSKTAPAEYLVETPFFDYSDPVIQQAITEILSESRSVEDAAKNTLFYVYQNVVYDYNEGDNVCFSRKASDILKKRIGQCDTQTRVNIAILRGMGIAARPEAGCLAFDSTCMTTFAVLGLRQPIIQEVIDGSRGGGLHTWVEVYLPGKGWVDAEATNGLLIRPDTCLNYVHELFPTSVFQECVSTDRSFIEMCKTL